MKYPKTLSVFLLFQLVFPPLFPPPLSKGKTAATVCLSPREIDRIIEHGAKLIAMTVNVCLQKNIDAKDLFSLVG